MLLPLPPARKRSEPLPLRDCRAAVFADTQLREVRPEADKIVERARQSLDYINELEPHRREFVRRPVFCKGIWVCSSNGGDGAGGGSLPGSPCFHFVYSSPRYGLQTPSPMLYLNKSAGRATGFSASSLSYSPKEMVSKNGVQAPQMS
jgi:hypothetical protein